MKSIISAVCVFMFLAGGVYGENFSDVGQNKWVQLSKGPVNSYVKPVYDPGNNVMVMLMGDCTNSYQSRLARGSALDETVCTYKRG